VTSTRLDRHYQSLEHRFKLSEAPDLGALVVPNGNADRPFHRWFHLKEGYSCDLLAHVLDQTGLRDRTELAILDPFVGGGTTIVSAAEWARSEPGRRVNAVGIERNPFLAFLAATKAEALVAANEIIIGGPPDPVGMAETLPGLSTFRNADFFEPDDLQDLLKLRRAILAEQDGLARRLRLLALVTCVEPVSRLRRDGRTLRRASDKARVQARDELRQRLEWIRHDLATRDLDGGQTIDLAVHDGDGRTLAAVAADHFKADLVVCSPPYPNNIDYTEVYKLEGWFMGAYASAADFRSQRHRTLRSHPSVKFEEPPELDDDELGAKLSELTEPLVATLPTDRYRPGRERLIRGYVEDVAMSLKGCFAATKPSGWMALVVGNSLHGAPDNALLVAADLLIARAGELVGWDVVRIDVGRRPVRRSAAYPRLRESMVLLRKPA
jgi:hypothetical protein